MIIKGQNCTLKKCSKKRDCLYFGHCTYWIGICTICFFTLLKQLPIIKITWIPDIFLSEIDMQHCNNINVCNSISLCEVQTNNITRKKNKIQKILFFSKWCKLKLYYEYRSANLSLLYFRTTTEKFSVMFPILT